MLDDADTIELAETELARLIGVMHKQGLSYHQILRIFLIASNDIYIQMDAENWLKEGNK